MRSAFTHAKESNDDERLEYTRKWVNQAKTGVYKSLVNRVSYYRDYGAPLNKKLDIAIKNQKKKKYWKRILTPPQKYKKALQDRLKIRNKIDKWQKVYNKWARLGDKIDAEGKKHKEKAQQIMGQAAIALKKAEAVVKRASARDRKYKMKLEMIARKKAIAKAKREKAKQAALAKAGTGKKGKKGKKGK